MCRPMPKVDLCYARAARRVTLLSACDASESVCRQRALTFVSPHIFHKYFRSVHVERVRVVGPMDLRITWQTGRLSD